MSASAVLKLQAAGFSVEQVTALAELVDSQASSKSDLLEVEHRLETKIGDVEHRLEAKIDEVEHRLGARIDGLEHRMDVKAADLKIDMIKWMIGLLLAQTGLLLVCLKLFLR